MTKIIKRRKLHGLESEAPHFAQIGQPGNLTLAEMLKATIGDKIYVCGPLAAMTREWMEAPDGWKFGREFAFKHRTAVYESENTGKEIAVKLISHRESWFPGCEDAKVALEAWRALREEWSSTGLPLLSSPAATGKALLWETLPRDVEFPALPDDLARLIRANSPQHRIEQFKHCDSPSRHESGVCEKCAKDVIQYDGRLMYPSLCGLDRLPVGEPVRTGGFVAYVPGIYDVTMRVPETWARIGLIPQRGERGEWLYPNAPGLRFRTWAFEPELTLALKQGWEIFDVHDGYAFDKGRPLASWSAKLIEMREHLRRIEQSWQASGSEGVADTDGACYHYAAAAVRQILNHTIGAMHKNEFQREEFVSDDNFRKWRRENPRLAEGDDVERVEGGWLVPAFVPDTSRLSIFMPHWSSTVYSLARARVAEWALRCDPSTLVKIHGDAIYSTIEQPELDKLDDNKTLGRPRRK